MHKEKRARFKARALKLLKNKTIIVNIGNKDIGNKSKYDIDLI